MLSKRILGKFLSKKAETLVMISFLFALLPLHCNLLEVALDGSQPFTVIQTAINQASDGDSILVYPGTYYENLDFLEKSLTLTSLYSFNTSDSIIHNTIIDGNLYRRCITIENADSIAIIGFTIQNGKAQNEYGDPNNGGGISIEFTNFSTIKFNIIKNNYAGGGGGLFFLFSAGFLEGNIIKNNYSRSGGGLNFAFPDSYIVFDESNRNSIFLNYASTGTDIYQNPTAPFTEVILDTFTVAEPQHFHAARLENYSFSIEHAKIDPIDADFYCAPWGSNENTGLSPNDPLKSIYLAQMLIDCSNDNPHTIFLDEGTYLTTDPDQRFPLALRAGLTIEGDDSQTTIIDSEGDEIGQFGYTAMDSSFKKVTLRNLTLTGLVRDWLTTRNLHCRSRSDLTLENVIFDNNICGRSVKVNEGNHKFINCTFSNHQGASNLTVLNDIVNNDLGINEDLELVIENSVFFHNYPNPLEEFQSGQAFGFSGSSEGLGYAECTLKNVLFYDNYNDSFSPPDIGGVSAARVMYADETNVINCTFTDNNSIMGSALYYNAGTNNIYNSILYDNDYWEVTLHDSPPDTTHLNIYNSLIEGGSESIDIAYEDDVCSINWYGNNLDEDPFFNLENELHPYSLTEDSPCIDAGTLILPEGIELPETDLSGNSRIVGETIDMGAYEFQENNIADEAVIDPEPYKINVYPNPYKLSENNSACHIWFAVPEKGKTDIAIYNIKGQKIRTLINSHTTSGEHSIKWYGNNSNNKKIASGVYFIRFKQNEVTKTRKMLVVK